MLIYVSQYVSNPGPCGNFHPDSLPKGLLLVFKKKIPIKIKFQMQRNSERGQNFRFSSDMIIS